MDPVGQTLSTVTQLSNYPILIRLLGGMWIWGCRHNDEKKSETRHHVRAVIALVGSTTQGLPRDELAESLWPRSTPSAARNRLYHTVHLVRQALSELAWEDEWITVRNGQVQFDSRVWCDLYELEKAAERVTNNIAPDDLLDVLSYCQDGWAPGLDVGEPGDLIRLKVKGLQATVLRDAVERSVNLGDTPALRELLKLLLRVQPTDEEAYRTLMKLDLQTGRRHAVLRTFETVSRELTTRLGLKPTAETIAIADTAAAQLQHPGESADLQLSAGFHSAIGRETQIHYLVHQLSGVSGGLWNVTGMSGIGKTAFVREVIRRLPPQVVEANYVVSMCEMSNRTAAVTASVRALGVAASHQDGEFDALTRSLQSRHILLFIDDVDLDDDATLFLNRLPLDSMHAKVIVTSALPLQGTFAVQVPLPLLPVPSHHATASRARQSAAFALFQLRCPGAAPAQLPLAWTRDTIELVRNLDGLPFAIELAALHTATMTPGEILSPLMSSRPLVADRPERMPGHHILKTALDWSVGMLSESALKVYCASSIFSGGFTPEDIGSLIEALDMAPDTLPVQLDLLVSARLVDRPVRGHSYFMLQLQRAHARGLALERGTWSTLMTLHLRRVVHEFKLNALVHSAPTVSMRLRRIDELEQDALGLLDFARQTDPAAFVFLICTLCEAWLSHSHGAIVQRWIQPALDEARSLCNVDAELQLLVCHVHVLTQSGQFTQAEDACNAMELILVQSDDKMLKARATSEKAKLLSAKPNSNAL